MAIDLTWWHFLAVALLPPPLLLVGVLSTPAPRDVRRKVLWFTERVLGWEVRRPFTLLHAAVLATGCSLLACLPLALQAEQELADAHAKPGYDANVLMLLLSQKFRRERNVWISLATFTAWVMLYIVHKVNREKHELRGRLLALQGCTAEAASEVAFMGSGAELEMRKLGSKAAAAGGGSAAAKGDACAALGADLAADLAPLAAGLAKKAE